MHQQDNREKRDQEIIENTRSRIKDGRFQDCPCKKTDCVRHGVCSECTAVHRNNRTSLPACLRNISDHRASGASNEKS
jgi:hypothetical protein